MIGKYYLHGRDSPVGAASVGQVRRMASWPSLGRLGAVGVGSDGLQSSLENIAF
jgi:hypothetical protein